MGQKKQKQNDKKNVKNTDKSKQRKLIFGIVLVVVSFFLAVAFVSYFFSWQTDQSIWSDISNRQEKADNIASKIGAFLGHIFIYKGFGIAMFIPVSLSFLSGLKLMFNLKTPLINKWFWGTLWMIFIATFLGFFSGKASILGGMSGFEINRFLQDYLGKFGTVLLLLLFLTLFAVFKMNLTSESISTFFSNISLKLKKYKPSISPTRKPNNTEKTDNEDNNFYDKEEKTDFLVKDKEIEKLDVFTHKKEIPFLNNTIDNIEIEEGFFIAKPTSEEPDFEVEKPKPTEEIDPELLAQKLVENYGEYDPRLDLSDYRFPSIDLLDEPKDNGIIINQEELEENKNTIVQTLRDYKIEISQIKATIGPTVTLYEIVPAAGIRISKIKNLEDDIALSLAALGIRIIAPIPGKGTIGIEVPNKKPTTVFMRSMITSPKFQHAEMELPVAFGKTISNETFVADLTKMPHLLMAGATGQGKSVGLNVVLTSAQAAWARPVRTTRAGGVFAS